MKVIMGPDPARKALSRRNWGFLIEVVMAEEYDILTEIV